MLVVLKKIDEIKAEEKEYSKKGLKNVSDKSDRIL